MLTGSTDVLYRLTLPTYFADLLYLRVGPVLVVADGEVGAGAREQRPGARGGEVGTRAVVHAGAVGVRVRVRGRGRAT